MKKYLPIITLGFITTSIMVFSFAFIARVEPSEPVMPAADTPVSTPNAQVDSGTDSEKENQSPRTSSALSATQQSAITATTPTTSADEAYPRSEPAAEELVEIDNKLYPLRTYKTTALPNDPSANQWWVQQTKLPQAWDIPQGTYQTKLAVIDTGFALNHEEFDNRWLKNDGEMGATTTEAASRLNCTDRGITLDASCNLIDDDFDTIVDNESGATSLENPSQLNCTDQSIPLTKECNRIDDDSNGYIDDILGFDFVNYDNSTQAGETNPDGDGTTHGTLTAGIAAATGNNGKGIAGVDWQTKILPIQALDDDSYGDTRSVGRAIYYAVSQNVDVINLSLGSAAPDTYVRQAVQAATKKGITVVASAGNDGCNCMLYPANYPEAIAVGALDESNQRAYFSSYGANLDFTAPGTNLRSPTWSATNGRSSYQSGVAGTSFSAPLVSGLLTRLISQRSDMTPQQQYAAVSENLNRLGISSDRTDTLGFGTVDANAASKRVTNPYTRDIRYAFTPVSLGNFLSNSSPTDELGTYSVHKCDDNKYGTTKLYKLTKSGMKFYTASHVEAANAIASGYTSVLFAYVCMQQPQDQADTLRLLNIEREF